MVCFILEVFNMNAVLKVLGDYEIVKQIGQGALGKVFLAEHRFMKKPFALKVFPEDLCREKDLFSGLKKKLRILQC